MRNFKTSDGAKCSPVLSVPLWPILTSQWGPSCWSLWLTPATPPLAGRTVLTHSKHSGRGGRGAQERRPHRPLHGVPALRHVRLCRKQLDRVDLKEGIKSSQ